MKNFSANEEIKKLRMKKLRSFFLSELLDGRSAHRWMGHTQYAAYAIASCILPATPESYITQCLECLSFEEHKMVTHSRTLSRLPANSQFRSYLFIRAVSSCQTSLRYSGDALTLWPPTRLSRFGHQNSVLWSTMTKLARRLHLSNEKTLFNQQEFLEGNEGEPTQDLVGCVVGYAEPHNQDCDRDVHMAAAGALWKHPVSALPRATR